jgi:hypothetical protein
MAKESFSQRKLSESLNLALIELILKNAAKDSISGWRPIIFLNVPCDCDLSRYQRYLEAMCERLQVE